MNRDAPFSVQFTHRLRFTHDAFDPRNATLSDLMPAEAGAPAKALVFLDGGVVRCWPDLPPRIAAFANARAHTLNLAAASVILPGQEDIKNDLEHFRGIIAAIHAARLCRHSYVIAVGGGAVLDAVGFAAAIAHRGIRLIRLPTTTLSQADSGVGVKNGVNAFGQKNFLGSFVPPWAVVNDEAFLSTLSERDWRCGFVEAVKVGLIRDAAFFRHVAASAGPICRRDPDVALPILRRSANLHLDHIVCGGDPFELTHARPLDFGHWSAHRLEQLTQYRLRHGEAVAIGMALDATYAALAGSVSPADADAIRQSLLDLGFALWDDALADADALLAGLEEFREHLGGPLAIPMLRGIGEVFDLHEMDPALVRLAMETLRQRPLRIGRARTGQAPMRTASKAV